MKFLLYSDMHWLEKRLDDLEKVHDKIGAMAIDLGVDYLINGGDTFHERGLIRTRVWDRLYRCRKGWAKEGLKNIDLIGNHDQEDKNGEIHPMKVFENFPGWLVYDHFQYNCDLKMFFIPHMRDYSRAISAMKLIDGDFDVVVHAGIRGANMSAVHKDSDGISPEVFKKANRVFAGHYHMHHRIDDTNVIYIGSPMQHSFSEMKQKKGVLYVNNGKVRFFEIGGMPKHHEIVVSWRDGKKTVRRPEGIQEGDIVRVMVNGDNEQVKSFSVDELELPKGRLKIERDVEDRVFSRLNIESHETEDIKLLVGKYVDFVNPDLDRKKLMEVWGEIAAS